MPTYQETADEFGFRSLNSVTKHVRLLRQKCLLDSGSRKARSLRIISPQAKLRSRIVDIPPLVQSRLAHPKPVNRRPKAAPWLT
jgi:hypothetical protein